MTQRTNIVYWLRGAKFVEFAQLSIASVRKVDPTAAIHVWTDEPETTPRITNVAWHTLESGRPAMVANLDAQIDALNYFMLGDRVLFLDADTLLRRAFPWAGWPELYVTWRDHVNHDPDLEEFVRLQPYNYGVIAAHVSAVTREAFLWVRARILQMSSRNQAWHGNQLALAELLGAAPPAGIVDKEARIRWSVGDRGTPLRVRQLPCETFNYTPNKVEDVSERAILHLKGDRKDLMQHYAEVA